MPVEAQPPKRTSGRVIPHGLKWHGKLAALAIYSLANFITAATRVRVIDEGNSLVSGGGPIIFAVWHNRLALCMAAWREAHKRLGEESRLGALISASKDGALLARVLEYFEVHPVRGSSSRRGGQALVELVSIIEQGYSVAITPDGPRGPKYVVHDGIIALASVTRAPIVPVSIATKSRWELKSWDNFQIPLPFTSATMIFHKPIKVPRETSDTDRERLRGELREQLLKSERGR